MNIENYMFYVLYSLIYLGLAVVMKYILNIKSASYYEADSQIAGGNIAVGLRRSGAQLGLAIAMIGVMSGSTNADWLSDITTTVIYGLVAIGFMMTSLFITDKAMLPKLNNTEELKKGNVAVGFVEFGTLIMTGILAYASIKGDEGGVLSSIVYFFVGQASIIFLVFIYEKVLARKINPVACIADANLSAGIYLSGKIIAYGLILQSAIIGSGNTASIGDAAIEYITAAILGIVLLYLFEILIDLVIITSTKVRDIIIKDQLVAAIQLSFAKIGMALLLGMAIL